MRNFSDKICRENQIHILCSVIFLDSAAVYENVGKNVEPDRP